MNANEKHAPMRALFLITAPKYSEKAADMFRKGAVPIQYMWKAAGTAPNEVMDILGLGSPDKSVLISMLPKPFADKMLQMLQKELKLGKTNSGIAFTLPMSGANNLILCMLEKLREGAREEKGLPGRKDEIMMADSKYSLIVAVVDQGYSEEVMDAARSAGAGGGTVVHSRRIGNKEAMGFWGMSIQEEKEMLFIVTENESKLRIMQAIGEKCGMHSEAKGIVLSLPIDTAIGLNEQ